ncbi:MAG TPA: DUF1566 domain-containing protein [Gammaproteobacteria bacterium]|nr:DUF1566 domain-containing protein [Gammaproteobacteria bacterium]
MGHLFYNEFGTVANTSVLTTGDPTELAKFTNVQVSDYWSGTEFAPDPVGAWLFRFGLGDQFTRIKSFNMLAWAVRPGDVSVIPVLAALWLFGSGLIGLLRLARRKR